MTDVNVKSEILLAPMFYSIKTENGTPKARNPDVGQLALGFSVPEMHMIFQRALTSVFRHDS